MYSFVKDLKINMEWITNSPGAGGARCGVWEILAGGLTSAAGAASPPAASLVPTTTASHLQPVLTDALGADLQPLPVLPSNVAKI